MTMKNQVVRIAMFYCSNSLQQDELGFLGSKAKDVKINHISLPCAGKVNLLYLLKAFETGSDGVLLVSCKLGECKYLQGNFRAQKRVGYVDSLLSEIGFDRRCIRFVSLEEDNKTDILLSAINELAEALRVELQEVQ
jgi:coenzyme F420-reducing hydrogenase delta subunit